MQRISNVCSGLVLNPCSRQIQVSCARQIPFRLRVIYSHNLSRPKWQLGCLGRFWPIKMDITLTWLIPVSACQRFSVMKSRVIFVTSRGWAQHHQYRLGYNAASIRLYQTERRRKQNSRLKENWHWTELIDRTFENNNTSLRGWLLTATIRNMSLSEYVMGDEHPRSLHHHLICYCVIQQHSICKQCDPHYLHWYSTWCMASETISRPAKKDLMPLLKQSHCNEQSKLKISNQWFD